MGRRRLARRFGTRHLFLRFGQAVLVATGLKPDAEVVEGAGGGMHPLDVAVRQLTVTPGHFEPAVPEEALQTENIPSIPEKRDRAGVPQGVR